MMSKKELIMNVVSAHFSRIQELHFAVTSGQMSPKDYYAEIAKITAESDSLSAQLSKLDI